MSTRRPQIARRHGAAAFTLLELVIALAIGAIVATLATSGYEATVLRSRRLDALAALMTVASAQERHYLEHGRYAARFAPDAADAADAAPADLPDALPLAATSPDGHYALAIVTDAAALAYEATARPRGRQQRDGTCALFTLDHAGRRTAQGERGADTTARCWR